MDGFIFFGDLESKNREICYSERAYQKLLLYRFYFVGDQFTADSHANYN